MAKKGNRVTGNPRMYRAKRERTGRNVALYYYQKQEKYT